MQFSKRLGYTPALIIGVICTACAISIEMCAFAIQAHASEPEPPYIGGFINLMLQKTTEEESVPATQQTTKPAQGTEFSDTDPNAGIEPHDPHEICMTQNDISTLFAEYRDSGTTEFTITCSEELFAEISENNFFILHRLERLGNIQERNMNYYDTLYKMNFSSVVYNDTPVYVCDTMPQAEAAILSIDFTQVTKFNLLCSEDVYNTLFNNTRLPNLTARKGVKKTDYTGYSSIYYITVNDVTLFDAPYTYAKDETEFLEALNAYHQQSLSEFVIVTTPSLYERLLANDYEKLYELQALGQISKFRWTGNSASAHIAYTETTFVEVPRIPCSSTDDIIEVIKQMGASGVTDFDLVLGRELYAQMTENDLAAMTELQKEAGLTTYSWRSWYESLTLIGFEGANIVADVRQLTTLEEAIAYLTECAEKGDKVIYLFCSDELYTTLLEGTEYPDSEDLKYLYDIFDSCGFIHSPYTYYNSSHIIAIKDIVYYPGTEIMHAVKNGTTASLEPRLKATYEAALELANRAKSVSSDPVEIARYIHDELAAQVTYYTNDYSDDDDNAVGALLDGLANCDGYSDAFYLAGTLAGLEIRYQHGDTYSKVSDETHMWNLMKVYGSWYAVDVTWDDGDDSFGIPSYKWFLAGADRMNRTHFWNRVPTVELAQTTNMDLRPRVEYIAYSYSDFDIIAADITAYMRPYAEVYFEMDNADDAFSNLFSYLHSYGVGNIRYNWDSNMHCLFLKYMEY
ncbi:MAG: transglutaminase domain-containing protein [Coriobacteriales bacterium]|nr:transglutaminase domain-containing protein [Coriobacteriales bacterium]